MTAALAVGFLALAAANRSIGRSLLYPPALFCAAWAGYMAAAFLSRDTYFPISSDTLLLFFSGGMAMSAGGALAMLFEPRRSGNAGLPEGAPLAAACRPAAVVRRLIDLASAVVVAAVPIRLLRLRELAGGTRLDLVASDFWVRVRQAAILESDEGGYSWLSLSDNLVLLALFVALAAVADDVAGRKLRLRSAVVVVVALFYQLSTASRSTGMSLVCGLIGIAWMASGRWSLRSALLGAAGVLLVFTTAAVFMNKGGRLDDSFAENARGVGEAALLYGVGPIVAFEEAYHDPEEVPPAWSIGYSLAQVANKLGAGIELPSIHAQYSNVAPGLWMNVYTMYFAYVPDFGAGGAVALVLVVGAGLTWLFRLAVAGDPRARLVYATTLSAILMSGFNEQLFMSLSFYAKAGVFSVLLYGLPGRHAPSSVRRPSITGARQSAPLIGPPRLGR